MDALEIAIESAADGQQRTGFGEPFTNSDIFDVAIPHVAASSAAPKANCRFYTA